MEETNICPFCLQEPSYYFLTPGKINGYTYEGVTELHCENEWCPVQPSWNIFEEGKDD